MLVSHLPTLIGLNAILHRKFSNRCNPLWNNDNIHAVASVRFHVGIAGFLVMVTLFSCYFNGILGSDDSYTYRYVVLYTSVYTQDI
jgi:hypothetical protein